MPRSPLAHAALLAVLAVAAGCGPDLDSQVSVPARNPEDSGADRPPVVVKDWDQRAEGRGFPDRLPAGLSRAVRESVEVRVDMVNAGEQLVVQVSVRTRGEKPLAFADWTDPKGVTLRDPSGREYPLILWTAEQVKTLREWEAGRPDPGFGTGAGEVTRARPRVTTLQFDVAARGAEHLDLDLSGAAVGWADPIRFRIPQAMIMPAGVP